MFVVEDLQEIAKQPSAQLRLRSLIDLIKPVGGRIVITSRISPRVLPGLSAGLRSRLAGGLIVPLRAPSYETRLEMIHAFAATVDCEISLRAADVLARRESLGPCELIDAVTQLARRAVTTNQNLRSIDESMIDVTSDSPNRAPRIHKIAAATAKCFGLTVADLKGRSRRRGVANARCLLMYLAWKKGGYRLKQIGQYLDGRDHSTVLHGCQKTKQRLTEDQTTQQWIDEIVERLT
jgi:chromosomal replication initiator protein